jgi:coenzyme F420-dependent glucose-6-phosphate dehydrogenase
VNRARSGATARTLRISSDPARHVEWLQRDIGLGFDALYLHDVGLEQERFVEVFGTDVLPKLRRGPPPAA